MATLFVRGDKPLTREQIEHNSRVKARTRRQICKEQARLGIGPSFVNPVPSVRDMAEIMRPPMEDKRNEMETHAYWEEVRKYYKGVLPELRKKILALPDDPPEDLMREQIQKDIELEAREEHRIRVQKDQYPEYYSD